MEEDATVKKEMDVRSRSPSAEPVDLPQGVQDAIDVICGDARGVLCIKRARVLYEGAEISPTELEKIGGRGASKKWKQSIRVVYSDGKIGPLIGDWLQSQGLDIRHSQLVRYTGKPSPPPAVRPQRPVVRPQPAAKAVPAVKLPRPAAASKPQLLQTPSVDLLVHLQSQYIGFIPGDPTAECVPAELPASSLGSAPSDVTVIHVDRISHEELMQMSRDSAPDPLGALLPNQPGILPEREAHLTGHQPAKRPQVTPVADVNEAAALIGDYMTGRLADPPWHAFGLNREPLICGVDLNLKHLYEAVQSHGGFDATISKKCWGKIATKLGIDKSTHTNASFLLKNTYTKFLLAYERQARALGNRSSSKDLPGLKETDEQTKTHEPTDAPSEDSMQEAPAGGNGAASQAEDESSQPAAAVMQDAAEQQTAHAGDGGDTSDIAADEAAQSSRDDDWDDRTPLEIETGPESHGLIADAPVPQAVLEQEEQHKCEAQQQIQVTGVSRTQGLKPDPGILAVQAVNKACELHDVIVLD